MAQADVRINELVRVEIEIDIIRDLQNLVVQIEESKGPYNSDYEAYLRDLMDANTERAVQLNAVLDMLANGMIDDAKKALVMTRRKALA